MNVQQTVKASMLSASGLTCLSLVIPEEVVAFTVKLAIAFPIGILGGIGTALGTMLVKRIFNKKDKP